MNSTIRYYTRTTRDKWCVCACATPIPYEMLCTVYTLHLRERELCQWVAKHTDGAVSSWMATCKCVNVNASGISAKSSSMPHCVWSATDGCRSNAASGRTNGHAIIHSSHFIYETRKGINLHFNLSLIDSDNTDMTTGIIDNLLTINNYWIQSINSRWISMMIALLNRIFFSQFIFTLLVAREHQIQCLFFCWNTHIDEAEIT